MSELPARTADTAGLDGDSGPAGTTAGPDPAPLTAAAVHELAGRANAVARPAMLADDSDPLTLTLWALTNSVFRISELLDDNDCRLYGRDFLVQDLAQQLEDALYHARTLVHPGETERHPA